MAEQAETLFRTEPRTLSQEEIRAQGRTSHGEGRALQHADAERAAIDLFLVTEPVRSDPDQALEHLLADPERARHWIEHPDDRVALHLLERILRLKGHPSEQAASRQAVSALKSRSPKAFSLFLDALHRDGSLMTPALRRLLGFWGPELIRRSRRGDWFPEDEEDREAAAALSRLSRHTARVIAWASDPERSPEELAQALEACRDTHLVSVIASVGRNLSYEQTLELERTHPGDLAANPGLHPDELWRLLLRDDGSSDEQRRVQAHVARQARDRGLALPDAVLERLIVVKKLRPARTGEEAPTTVSEPSTEGLEVALSIPVLSRAQLERVIEVTRNLADSPSPPMNTPHVERSLERQPEVDETIFRSFYSALPASLSASDGLTDARLQVARSAARWAAAREEGPSRDFVQFLLDAGLPAELALVRSDWVPVERLGERLKGGHLRSVIYRRLSEMTAEEGPLPAPLAETLIERLARSSSETTAHTVRLLLGHLDRIGVAPPLDPEALVPLLKHEDSAIREQAFEAAGDLEIRNIEGDEPRVMKERRDAPSAAERRLAL